MSSFGIGLCPLSQLCALEVCIPFAVFPFPFITVVCLHPFLPCALYPMGPLPHTAVLLPPDWNKHPLQASEVPLLRARTWRKGFVPCSMSWAFQSQSSAMGMLEIFSDISDFTTSSLKTLPGICFHHCLWCLVTHTGQSSGLHLMRSPASL